MSVRRAVARVLKAAGLGLAVVGLLLDDEQPVAASEASAASAEEAADDDEDADGDVHVMPAYGREHDTSVRCWCRPTRDDDERRVVVHREDN